MKPLFIIKYINLIILVLIINIQQISSAADLLSGHTVSLYNATDKITVLNGQSFSSIVYQSNTAWLVEFYANWCGHCQSYAATYREIAIDIWTWKTVVRIGAINCVGGENQDLCRQHGVHAFPTIRLIPPGAVFDNKSKPIQIAANDAKTVTKDLIKELDNMYRQYKSWPHFTPVNRITLEDLYARIPPTIKLLFVIAEKRDDLTGRQIMLDFSKYGEQLAIYRTTTDGRLWLKLQINVTDVPALFVILRNRTAERIDIKQKISNNTSHRQLFNDAIRLHIRTTKYIDNFDDHDFEEVIRSRNALRPAVTKRKIVYNKDGIDDNIDKDRIRRKINMIDLELALSYMFRQEIPQMKEIQGEAYDALVHWLTVLTKYFPGRESVMIYLKQLLSKVNEQSNGFSGNKFREMIDMKTSNAYLPDDHDQYQYCAGSEPRLRGYPCALWLLFHTLTVSQYQKESDQINVIEIPSAIKGYIKHFFACRQCSNNFMKETADINQLDTKNKYEAILYLWKIHNHVNKRLHGNTNEDPEHPKVQFPSKYLCATCQPIDSNKAHSSIIGFLIEYYSKENIDTPLVSTKTNLKKDLLNRQEYIVSKMEYNKETTEETGLLRFFPTIVQHFPVYTLIAFIIIIALFRHRRSRSKGTRYIL